MKLPLARPCRRLTPPTSTIGLLLRGRYTSQQTKLTPVTYAGGPPIAIPPRPRAAPPKDPYRIAGSKERGDKTSNNRTNLVSRSSIIQIDPPSRTVYNKGMLKHPYRYADPFPLFVSTSHPPGYPPRMIHWVGAGSVEENYSKIAIISKNFLSLGHERFGNQQHIRNRNNIKAEGCH